MIHCNAFDLGTLLMYTNYTFLALVFVWLNGRLILFCIFGSSFVSHFECLVSDLFFSALIFSKLLVIYPF